MPRKYHFFLPTANIELLKQNRILENSPLLHDLNILPYSKTSLMTLINVTFKILHNNTCQHSKDLHSLGRVVFSK